MLKAFPTAVNGQRVEFKVGEHIPAEVARSWPIPNRLAMQSARLVRYFETSEEAEKMGPALSAAARRNPERAMMDAEAAAEKRPARRAPVVSAAARSAAQKKRAATLARKRAEALAKITAPSPAPEPVAAVEAPQPAA